MDYLEKLNQIVWGVPTLLMLIGVGLYLSLRTHFAQIRFFPAAIRMFMSRFRWENGGEGSTSAYQALCTALAATVGTGNVAGVAGAIAIGGPGAIFWMWICAVVGMMTKFAEATLAVRYRVKTSSGEYAGGPMYMIENGMGSRWKWLAGVYSFLGVVAAFGVGNATQINAVISGAGEAVKAFGGHLTPAGKITIGAGMGLIVYLLLSGGAKRIGVAAERLVPLAAGAYLMLGFGVLAARVQYIPQAFRAIIQGAFSPQAVTGGIIGSWCMTLRIGVSRGIFTNEAGMGTASMAHASAQVDHPVQQGMMGIIEVFVDTILICTMTALVILCSGVSIDYGTDPGVVLTNTAFASVYGKWISLFLTLALCCFAFATVLGWGLYGLRCAQYLFDTDAWRGFAVVQAVIVVLSTVLETKTIWLLADTINGLMAIPNLIALAVLSPELLRLTAEYRRKSAALGLHNNQKWEAMQPREKKKRFKMDFSMKQDNPSIKT